MSTIINVSTPDQLWTALSQSSGQEILSLAPGDYGKLDLSAQNDAFVKFPGNVTIQSADPGNPASFSSLSLNGVENLTFDSVKFDYSAAAGVPDWNNDFLVQQSTNITIQNSSFDGALAQGVSSAIDGYPTGVALNVFSSAGVAIENCEFYDFMRAAVFSQVDGLVVSGNNIHDIRSDGLDFTDVDNVLINGNYIHDFKVAPASDDHVDMIQFWTAGTTSPSTNIDIRGNFLDSGHGSWTQSIFMRNEQVDQGLAGQEMFYKNITIENNVIYNAHIHGITVGETDGLTIQNNTVLQNPASGDSRLVTVPGINVAEASLDVLIAGNVAEEFSIGPTAERRVESNLLVQHTDPTLPNYVGLLFVNPLVGGDATLADLQPLPNSLIAQLHVGATLTDAELLGKVSFAADSTGEVTENRQVSVSGELADTLPSTGGTGLTIVGDCGAFQIAADGRWTYTLDCSNSSVAALGSRSAPLTDRVAVTLASGVQQDIVVSIHGTDRDQTLTATSAGQTLVGGDGNDTYVLNNLANIGVDDSGGTDTVTTLTSRSLATYSDIENLTLLGSAAGNLTGSDLDNVLTGNRGVNVINGGNGNDTLIGGGGNDTLIGGAGDDMLVGTSGAVKLQGGDGDDTYLLGDNTTVTITDTSGMDTVTSTTTRSLASMATIENLTLLGSANVNGTGNGLANTITGNDGNNVLDGGAGADTLAGGLGNDTYVVDSTGDKVVELAGQGTDTVRSSVTLTLAANVENLTLTGGAAINGTGNDSDNVIIGNSAANKLIGGAGNDTLDGGAGKDTLTGGLGNDTYVVDSTGDKVVELAGQGTDTVRSSVTLTLAANVENLTLTSGAAISGTGNNADNVIIGNSAANQLVGGIGNDTLSGGLGNDTLTGGSGADHFVFNTALSSANIDRISDFSVVQDKIILDTGIFAALADGELSAGDFGIGTKATTADTHIFYNSATGGLFYDADGNGAATAHQFATLAKGLALTASDFFAI